MWGDRVGERLKSELQPQGTQPEQATRQPHLRDSFHISILHVQKHNPHSLGFPSLNGIFLSGKFQPV